MKVFAVTRLGILFVWLLVSCQGAPAQELRLELPEVLFTDLAELEDSEKDKALLRRVEQLITNTPSGKEITLCMFKFEIQRLAEALIAAEKRGVRVRVILNDGDTSEETNDEIAELLDEELTDFHFIENDISKKGIIHNKFILFSEVSTTGGDLPHIIVQTSSNFQKKGTKKLQDMVIFSNAALYHGYLDFWYDIKVLGGIDQLDHYEYRNVEDASGRFKAYFYPKIKDQESHGKDNVLKALQDIDDPKGAEIRFAHGKWSEKRLEVVRELEDLVDEGASVTVLTNGDIDKDIKEAFEDLSKQVHYLDKDFNMHTKFFLIDDGKSKQVWTGSHNLTERSLRENFEVLLRIEDPAIYSQYLAYFEQMEKLIND